jgi:putative DNA primase/helicase
MRDYIEQFRTAIRNAGLTPPDAIEPDGNLHRFGSNGKHSDDAGWYVFHADGVPAGAFGDWRTGASETWRADIGRKLSPQEETKYHAHLAAIQRKRRAEEEERKADARKKAAAIWQEAALAQDDHPYLRAKGVKAHGLRAHGVSLTIPMRDGMEVHSLQLIACNGDKKFLTGGRVSGCYFLIGKPTGVLCIAEGYATGASVHEATGHSVAVAFNAGNLMPVAKALLQRFPHVRLIICADDDAGTKGNPGLSMSREAAKAVGGYLAVPDFGAGRLKDATDFNDLHRHAGLDAVRACVERAAKVATDDAAPLIFRRLSDVQAQPIHWLWPGRFARGKVSMIAGNPGLGKSQVTANLAAIVTTGGQWPVDGGTSKFGSVIFLSAEDDAADTIKPRLEAAGADTTRCYILDAVRDLDATGEARVRSFNLQCDIDRLAALLEDISDVALVVIDPISAYLGGTDSHKNADVRAVLAPLAELAARHAVAVVCVSHLNKAGGNEALMRVTGSMAFVAAARAAYVVARDKHDPLRRLFLPLKNNVGSDQVGLAFKVEPFDLEGGIQTSRVMWDAEAVTVSADEAMRPMESDDERDQQDEVADWLQDLLSLGRMKSHEVRTKATRAGIAWRTVQRAAKKVGVAMKREGFGPDMVSFWWLPTVAPSRASRASAETAAQMDEFGASGEIERGEL